MGMLNSEELQDVVKKLKDRGFQHYFYTKSVEIAMEIDETFSKDYPKFLAIQRPKESKKNAQYRKDIFLNPAMAHRSRIVDKLVKVEQSEDFLINYPEEETNELKKYCEQDFNGYNTLTNWVFTIGITAFANDPNSVIAVLDKTPPERESEGYKPYPYVFSSADVVACNNRYCVLKEKDEDNETLDTYYILDDTFYYILRPIEWRGATTELRGIRHHFKGYPAFKIGQYIQEVSPKGERLYKSFFTDAIPFFRSAIRRYNDMEIELIQHINTLEWQIEDKKCSSCKGKGGHNTTAGYQKCAACEGTGAVTWNQLDVLKVPMVEESPTSGNPKRTFPFNAPGGYVPRNIDALNAIRESVDSHIDDAYNALDVGILRKRNLVMAESGEAKQYDRLEFSQKIYSFGRHIIENIMLPIYRMIDAQLFGHTDQKDGRIPEVVVPINFDIMSPEMILEEIKLAKEGGMSKEVIGALELKYCKLVNGENSREAITLADEINLNPHYGKTVEELMLLYGGEGSAVNATKETDFIIAVNFKGFIDRAMREHKEWVGKVEAEKFSILEGYAKEVAAAKAPEQAQRVDEEIELEDAA